ncbi:MAG TPA: Gfo/Idh/MocA family oxidoreductase [Verrucomicrobiae bacterium]|jgi:predicted dehydrogenase|nr:Gfo/Idh/MocA family oxidoreductase [Verrucomicrobiae bacterium]
MSRIGVGIVGCGGIALQNHLPGLALCPDVAVVALCDANAEVLERAKKTTGTAFATSDFNDLVKRDDVHAVIIATPNFLHAPIALAAIQNGKHVFCEKPLAMNFEETRSMYRAAEKAGVRHMTAFTYRFVPAMRYFKHLVDQGAVGQPYHFRNCRLQDWEQRNLGWRQVAKFAGSGEIGDMLSHRIDFAHMLLGPMVRLVAHTRLYFPERGGQASDLEDWVAIISDFKAGATGVMESSKIATGHGESMYSQDYVELNGTDGSIRYDTQRPHEVLIAKRGEKKLKPVQIPNEFLVWPGSPRDPKQGDPLFVFRYDQTYEFIEAIRQQRRCFASFFDGAMAQGVIDAALRSEKEKCWVDVSDLDKRLAQ